MAADVEKVPFSLDKRRWHPSVLPGHIVVVSTIDPDGRANIAPKSWVTMAALRVPVVAFGCNVAHTTYQNIRASKAFVINIPDASLVEQIWRLPDHAGEERLRRSGFTLAPSQQVSPPLVAECSAHLECVYDSEKQYGQEVMIFGRVVAASMDADCLEGDPAGQYFRLRPAFFLEAGLCGTLDTAHQVNSLPPTNLRFFVVEVGEPTSAGDDRTVLEEHLAYLALLRRSGRLLMAGPFEAETPGEAGGGMYIVRTASREEAALVAKEDPLVLAGADVAIRAWRRTF